MLRDSKIGKRITFFMVSATKGLIPYCTYERNHVGRGYYRSRNFIQKTKVISSLGGKGVEQKINVMMMYRTFCTYVDFVKLHTVRSNAKSTSQRKFFLSFFSRYYQTMFFTKSFFKSNHFQYLRARRLLSGIDSRFLLDVNQGRI